MSIYMVSYDLRAPGRDYAPLYDALRSVPCIRPLESVWVIEVNNVAGAVRDWLRGFVDLNDGLMVIEISANAGWASFGISKFSNDWLLARRP